MDLPRIALGGGLCALGIDQGQLAALHSVSTFILHIVGSKYELISTVGVEGHGGTLIIRLNSGNLGDLCRCVTTGQDGSGDGEVTGQLVRQRRYIVDLPRIALGGGLCALGIDQGQLAALHSVSTFILHIVGSKYELISTVGVEGHGGALIIGLNSSNLRCFSRGAGLGRFFYRLSGVFCGIFLGRILADRG